LTDIIIGNDCHAIDIRDQFPAPYAFRDAGQVRRIIVHHDARGRPGRPIWTRDTEMIRIATVHEQHQSQGWPGIAYHFYVFPRHIYYTGDWATIRYHTAGPDDPDTPPIISKYNEDGIAVCLAGDFTNRPPGRAQLAQAALLVRNLRFLFNQAGLPVFAHRDLTNTACPGDTWPRWVHALQPHS